MRRVLPGLRLVTAVGWTTGVIAWYYARISFAPRARHLALRDDYKMAWARGLVRIFGGDVVIDPGPPAPCTKARFVVANHRESP